MFKTLKAKISMVYLCLVVLTAIVGSMSVFSLFKLSKSVDRLMVDNYKSINAVNNMMDALEKQDSSILLYINVDRKTGIDRFSENNKLFLKWYDVVFNNITEPGEKESIYSINDYYIEYTRLFSELQEVAKGYSNKQSVSFYNGKIIPHFNKLKLLLKDVSDINERAMFSSKAAATENSRNALYLLLIISMTAVAGGFLLSRFFINRFLAPMHSLINTIKLVREGDLNQQAEVISRDEVGDLASEFNNMTKRLQEYDRSSLGKLLVEKNKSLAIVKSINDPLIVMDTSYKILLINDACERFFEIKEEKSLNKHFLEVIRNGDLFEYISGAFESTMEFSEKIINIKSGEDEFYFNVIVTGVRDIDQKLTGLVVTFHNVTQLKQLDMVKTDFLSTISHEFKTPLTSIMMGTSLMENESLGQLTKQQRNVISTIHEDVERLTALVNDLLELSRVESGKAVFDMKPASIEDIIQNSMRTVHEQVKNKGVKMMAEFEDDLPMVKVDGEKITWVVNNLLSNALKYTRTGDSIRISAFGKDKRVHVSIKDNGIGIPAEYQKKIFERFVQVKGQDIEVRGTGLGLAIVKEIVEVHGGEIWCESKPEKGSTFTFTLPVTEG